MKFKIDYKNGTVDYLNTEDLESVKEFADSNIEDECTRKDCVIMDFNDIELCRRVWHDKPFREEYDQDDPIIFYAGFYSDWIESLEAFRRD